MRGSRGQPKIIHFFPILSRPEEIKNCGEIPFSHEMNVLKKGSTFCSFSLSLITHVAISSKGRATKPSKKQCRITIDPFYKVIRTSIASETDRDIERDRERELFNSFSSLFLSIEDNELQSPRSAP